MLFYLIFLLDFQLVLQLNSYQIIFLDLHLFSPIQRLQNIELVKAAKSSAEELLSNDPDFSKNPLLAERFKEFHQNIHYE